MTKCDSNSVIMKACEINARDNCSSMLYCQRYGDGYGNCHLWNVILIKEHQICHKPVINGHITWHSMFRRENGINLLTIHND
jgi:hypothetical protein